MRSAFAVGCFLLLLATSPCLAQPCIGDCNCDATVTINELITIVAIDLGTVPAITCPAAQCSCSPFPYFPFPGICCAIQSVNNALSGCPRFATPIPTATACGEVCGEQPPTPTPSPSPRPTLKCVGCDPDGFCTLTIQGAQYPGICTDSPVVGGQCGCIGRLDVCRGDGCNSGGNCATTGISGEPAAGHCQNCQCVANNCGEVEFVGGCCDLSGAFPPQPCHPLVAGADAGGCMFAHGYPMGCSGSVRCNQCTGQCEAQ